jgi:geranylgeranyl pyrophosphate synthase
MAFQIIDDIMDIVGNGSKMGKEIGTDVREGSLTIPVIYALQELKGDELDRLKELYRKEEKSKEDIEEALVLIRSTKAIEKSRDDAKQFADRARKALDSLKRNACRDEMVGLIEYILTRDH